MLSYQTRYLMQNNYNATSCFTVWHEIGNPSLFFVIYVHMYFFLIKL